MSLIIVAACVYPETMPGVWFAVEHVYRLRVLNTAKPCGERMQSFFFFLERGCLMFILPC